MIATEHLNNLQYYIHTQPTRPMNNQNIYKCAYCGTRMTFIHYKGCPVLRKQQMREMDQQWSFADGRPMPQQNKEALLELLEAVRETYDKKKTKA